MPALIWTRRAFSFNAAPLLQHTERVAYRFARIWYSPVSTTFSTKASCSSVRLILRVGIAILSVSGIFFHLWQSLPTLIDQAP